MKRLILIPIMLFLTNSLFSQIAISYFPFQSLLSVSSNTEYLLWADFKVETNTFFSNLNMELSAKYNFYKSEEVNSYFGAGYSFNPVYSASNLSITNGYFGDFGVRLKNIVKITKFQIVFELSPYINKELNGGNLRTRLGVSYNF